jgi:Tyrosine phosphatase family
VADNVRVENRLFVVLEGPAPLAGMAYPTEDTDWQELHRRGFRRLVRLQPGPCAPAPLVAEEVALEDLYGGRAPTEPAAEYERVAAASRLAAEGVASGDGVIVHCLGGTGRTGTVLACALRLLGFSADDAVAAVRHHRPRWPESAWQEATVRGMEP